MPFININHSLKILFLGLILIFSTTSLATENIHNQIDAVIKPFVEHEVFSGTVLVAEQGKVVYQRGHGLANRDWQMPNTPQTAFKLASLTKTFTAALVLKLVEQETLSLNDTINTYLPDFPKDKGTVITIEYLLSQRSGLPRAFVIPGWFTGRFNGGVSIQEFVKIIGELDLLFTPGTDSAYTNLSYILLGQIIESATGKPFEQVLQQQLLIPLKLSNTGIYRHTTIIKNKANGYRLGSQGGYRNPNYQNMAMFGAGAALYSTVEDLLKWDQALYLDRTDDNILSAKTKVLLFEPDNHYAWHFDDWAINQSKTTAKVIVGNGETPGFSSLLTRFVDQRRTIIILSNNAINSTEKIRMMDDIAAVLYNVETQQDKLPISFLFTKALVEGKLNQTIGQFEQHKQRYKIDEAGVNAIAQQQGWSQNFNNAIALFKFNTEHFAQSANAHQMLAKAYEQNNQKTKALASYRQALLLLPDNKALKRKISTLQ